MHLWIRRWKKLPILPSRSVRTAGPPLNDGIGWQSVEAAGGRRCHPGMANAEFDTLAVMHQLRLKGPDTDQGEAIVETVRTAVACGAMTKA